MSEWWTYRLSDFLLFSPRTYARLFELYNADLWPAQPFVVALGVLGAVLLLRRSERAARGFMLVLAAAWLWVAWAFHLQRYAAINWAAPGFAAAFALEALLLLACAWRAPQLRWREGPPALRRSGLALFLFALFVHPLLGVLVGRSGSQVELFGLAPDPTALGTLGLLLLIELPARRTQIVLCAPIPLLWCVIGGATQWALAAVRY